MNTTQTKHTGAWKVVVYHNSENGNTRIVIESATSPYQIATVHHDKMDHAQLIAAAPQLLEACKALLKSVEWAAAVLGDIPKNSTYMENIVKAKAAVYAAEHPRQVPVMVEQKGGWK